MIFNGSDYNDEFIKMYYENGLPPDMREYLQNTQSMDLMLFEEDVEKAVQKGVLHCTREQLKPAKRKLMDWASNEINNPIDYIEFGVYKGSTIKEMTNRFTESDNRFYGFDTFEGLPDAWVSTWGNHDIKMDRDKGTLNSNGMPVIIDSRVFLYKGLFQDTLPLFLNDVFKGRRNNDRQMFINIDSDIYSAALYVLTMIHPYLRNGDLIYFDEFFDSINEYAAFNDYMRAYYTKEKFKPIARAYDSFLFRFEENDAHQRSNEQDKPLKANVGIKSRISALSAIKALILGR